MADGLAVRKLVRIVVGTDMGFLVRLVALLQARGDGVDWDCDGGFFSHGDWEEGLGIVVNMQGLTLAFYSIPGRLER